MHFGIKMLHLENLGDLAALAFPPPSSDGSLLHFRFQKMAMANSEFLHDALGDADRVVFLHWESRGQGQERVGPVWSLRRHALDPDGFLGRGSGIGFGVAHGGFSGHDGVV